MPHARRRLRQSFNRRNRSICQPKMAGRGQGIRGAKPLKQRGGAAAVVVAGINKRIAVQQFLKLRVIQQIRFRLRHAVEINANAPVFITRFHAAQAMLQAGGRRQEIGVFFRAEAVGFHEDERRGKHHVSRVARRVNKLLIARRTGRPRKHQVETNDGRAHASQQRNHAGVQRAIPRPRAERVEAAVINADVDERGRHGNALPQAETIIQRFEFPFLKFIRKQRADRQDDEQRDGA